MAKRSTRKKPAAEKKPPAKPGKPVVISARRKWEPTPPSAEPKKRAASIYRRLAKVYPDAKCALVHDGPYQLLVATILSAQCTDVMVNKVTPAVFGRFPDVGAMARADQAELEGLVKSTGFFRNKASSIRESCQALVEQHGGEVLRTMDELTALPGVARKTANVVLGNAFGVNEGVVVDTHVMRLSQRLGLTEQKMPEKIEQELMLAFPRKNWTMLSHLLIHHGRQVCPARKPKCDACQLAELCPKVGVETAKEKGGATSGNA